MTDETPPRIGDMARNDIPAALAIVRWHFERGVPMRPEVGEMLMMMQDDHRELVRQWNVLAATYPPLPPWGSEDDEVFLLR